MDQHISKAWGLLLALSLLAPAVGAEEIDGDAARGAKFFSDNCSRCHNARPPVEHQDRDWSIVIVHMRVIAGLPGDQARDVEAFLRASNNPPRPLRLVDVPEPSVLSGEELIARYGCRGCHVIAGQGGAIGPNLERVFERRSEDWVRTQVQHPRSHNPTTVMPEFGLTDDQVNAILEVLR